MQNDTLKLDMGTTSASEKRRERSITQSHAHDTSSNRHHHGQQSHHIKHLSTPTRSRLTLERVLGITTLNNAMLAVNPVTGEIAYAAGCIVVIYNLRRNKQVRYYRVEKTVSCLCFSPSGQYLAIGEKGYLPAITIWDGTDGTLCAELQMHKYGVACMSFSRDGKYLLSAGLIHDQHMYAWDLRLNEETNQMNGKAIGVTVVEEKILSMDYCQEGNFFVTVGAQHFKFWFLDEQDTFVLTGFEVNGVPEIQGRNAVMTGKEHATFTSVACGMGAQKLKTFAITSDGTLCSIGVSCVMERIVSLEAECGNALSVTESYVAVGGSSAIVRLFNPSTLEYRGTMPFPPAFGKASEASNVVEGRQPVMLQPEHPLCYPATLSVRLSGSHLIALYSDRSLFIYDIADPQHVQIDRSFLFHSGSVRDLQIAGRVKGVNAKGKLVLSYGVSDSLYQRKTTTHNAIPHGTFVSCSDDNTMRFWHLDLHKATNKSNRFAQDKEKDEGDPETQGGPWKNPYSQEMLDIVYHDATVDFDGPAEGEQEESMPIVLGGTCSWNDQTDIHTPAKDPGHVNGLRAVAIHPDLTEVITGDKEGNLTLVSLPLRGDRKTSSITEIGAHNSEVHCVAYGVIRNDQKPSTNQFLVASGGRDRLVHVHDGAKAYAAIAKLENHSGAVTSLQFTNNGKKLISCGADKTIVFSDVSSDGKITRYNSVPFTGGKIYDIALTSDDEHLVASCNNRLDVLSISTGKVIKAHAIGEQHRIDVCPANYCVAMSGSLSDKTIHVVDLESGETLADGTGHGEVITAIRFTPDCRRLVSASSDGCIFVWRLAEELQSAIKERLHKVTDASVPPPAPPVPAPIASKPAPNTQSAAVTMPPPAPPMPPPAPPIQTRKPVTAIEPAAAKAPAAVPTRKIEHSKSTVVEKKDDATNAGWKGKSKAIPGPMAKIPMEDWMRTRESAKKTVHVTDDTSDTNFDTKQEQTDSKEASPSQKFTPSALVIDRSKTPDWARTFKVSPGHKKELNQDPSPTREQPRAGSKWNSNRHDDLNLEKYQDMNDEYVCDEGDDDLMNLSIANMDLHESTATFTSSSLAIEREQLEKRKKQLEMAKAVADMNSRLGRLGLLRPQKETKEIKAVPSVNIVEPGASPSVSAPSPPAPEVDRIVPSKSPPRPTPRVDVPVAMAESIELPSPSPKNRRKLRSPKRRGHKSPKAVARSVDLPVDQSMSTFTSGYTETVTKANVNDSINVTTINQSLSTFTTGYQETPEGIQQPEPNESRLGDHNSVSASQTIVNRALVGESLSSFTTGFSTAQANKHNSSHQSIDLSAVNASMSSFTQGYAGAAPSENKQSMVTQSIDLTPVNASLSQFTSGFVAEATDKSLKQSNTLRASRGAVDESLSSFTSGYTANSSPVQPSKQESAEVYPSLDVDVTSSLSVFTTGYEANRVTSLPPREVPQSKDNHTVSMLSTISDLDQQLSTTSSSLDKVVDQYGESSKEIEEIRELMAQLQNAVTRFVNNHNK